MKRASALRDVIVRELEEDIAEGRLGPGAPLDERLLAERFNVSRTPVREALNRLASNGFVETKRHQGAVVASMSVATLLEMFELMQTLEKTCAELAARRMSATERKALKSEAVRGVKIAEAGNRKKYAAHNVAFHKLIYNGARNAILTDLAQRTRQRVAVYRRLAFNIEGLMPTSAEQHTELAELIADNKPEQAGQLMSSHMKRSGPMYDDFLVLLSRSASATRTKRRTRKE